MSKAILVIDDIHESLFTENLSIEYQLLYYPDGHMKELGIHGKQLLKPMPERKFIYEEGNYQTDIEYILHAEGWNMCIDELLEGETEK